MKKTVSLVLVLAMIAVVWTGFGAAASASEAQAMNNTEKALALISTFATGDTDTARELLADDYIQHNLAYGTGADAFIGSVEYLASAEVKTTVNNIRAFEDGDKVFLQNAFGQPFPAVIAAKDETTITFDANHELAGQELNFKIELVEVAE